MKKLTIKEIAKMAGVSPTAVSFVINNKGGVSETTRKKVQEIIELTDFKPSVNSRRLSLKKSYNIAIIIKETSSPFKDLFYFDIAKAVLESSKSYGYNVVFTSLSKNGGHLDLPEILKNKDSDGAIFFQDIDQTILDYMDNLKIPYIVVDSHSPNNTLPAITIDYESSVYTATKYILNKGHKDISFIGSSYIPNFYVQAFTGYKNALSEANISINPDWIQINASDENSAFKCMEEILNRDSIPTAVVCANDTLAIGAMKCAKSLGYSIPKDISFIGLDDMLLSRYIDPMLTTVRIDKATMGKLSMDMLVKKIDGNDVKTTILQMNDVIERESVKNRLTH